VGAGYATVTPPALSATGVAQAVWSYSPRSLTDIQGLTAAIQNNDLNLLSSLSDLQYLPVPYFIEQVSATQVAAFIDNAIRNYNLAGAFANFISNNPYNLWSSGFVATIAAQPYITATALNMLISQASMDGNHAQAMLYSLAQNYYYNKWVYTITANAPSSVTFSTNTVLSTNVLIAQNITIASGVTVTCGTRTCFFIAQSFNNYGTIVSPYGAPGSAAPGTTYGSGPGGTGGGGVIILAVTAALGTINVNGSVGGTNVASASGGSTVGGSPGGTGLFAVLGGMTVPVGGAGGVGSTSPGPGEPNGGGGGGGGAPSVGGAGGVSVALSFSNGNDLVTYVMRGASDWWLSNVLGKAPSSVTPLLYVYGSGGGSGSANGGIGLGGGGGGGGGAGEVIVYGYNIISGTVNAAGGAGGGAVSATSTNHVGGGGGGGGGIVLLFYGATSGSVTANVNGGAGGPISGTGGAGSAGANGTLYIAAVTVNG